VLRGLDRTVIALARQLRRWLLAGVARAQPRRCHFCPLHGFLFAALQLGLALPDVLSVSSAACLSAGSPCLRGVGVCVSSCHSGAHCCHTLCVLLGLMPHGTCAHAAPLCLQGPGVGAADMFLVCVPAAGPCLGYPGSLWCLAAACRVTCDRSCTTSVSCCVLFQLTIGLVGCVCARDPSCDHRRVHAPLVAPSAATCAYRGRQQPSGGLPVCGVWPLLQPGM
jgi:hypothetical protein